MSRIEIHKNSITNLKTDAVVNAANSSLLQGGGVCGAIYKAAGPEKLAKECAKYGGCKTGSAVITSACGMKNNKFIIHAVGPRYVDGKHNEPVELYSCYLKSLELARENGCKSIGFPLISAGIFGYPLEEAWAIALSAARDFVSANADYDISIVFVSTDKDIAALGKKIQEEIGIDEVIAFKSFESKYSKLYAVIDELDDNMFTQCLKVLYPALNFRALKMEDIRRVDLKEKLTDYFEYSAVGNDLEALYAESCEGIIARYASFKSERDAAYSEARKETAKLLKENKDELTDLENYAMVFLSECRELSFADSKKSAEVKNAVYHLSAADFETAEKIKNSAKEYISSKRKIPGEMFSVKGIENNAALLVFTFNVLLLGRIMQFEGE